MSARQDAAAANATAVSNPVAAAVSCFSACPSQLDTAARQSLPCLHPNPHLRGDERHLCGTARQAGPEAQLGAHQHKHNDQLHCGWVGEGWESGGWVGG